jgi:nitroreductase
MVRSFDGSAIDEAPLVELCVESMRAPTAGNSAGVRMAVAGRELVPAFFEVATDEAWRNGAARASALARAGAVVVVWSEPTAYLERYAEGDKAAAQLSSLDRWPVPFWHTDAAMATMALLLLIEERGWQATIWGGFRADRAVLDFAEAPETAALFASVLVGRSDGRDRRSASLDRVVPTRRDRVRRLGVQ